MFLLDFEIVGTYIFSFVLNKKYFSENILISNIEQTINLYYLLVFLI